MSDQDDTENQGYFPQTQWTIVVKARDGGDQTVTDALSGLCYTYWKPVYAFIRRSGKSSHDAEDLTQGFFADLLGRNFLDNVSADKGKFRSFILTAVKNFLAKDWRKQNAQKRGSGITPLSLDFEEAENSFQAQETTQVSPDLAFERQWVLALLDSVMSSLELEYANTGKAKLFDAIKGGLTASGQTATQAEIAAQLDMQEGAVKVAAHRLKKRYREALKAEIARTINENDDLDAELGYLMNVFAR